MRFAYADPPYPGQAKRWYGNHPDYAGEVDHGELIERLCRDYPDGWALSTGAVMLQGVLALCPDDVAIAIWHNTTSRPAGARKWRWFYVWEAVIIRGGRSAPNVKNLISTPAASGFMARQLGVENFPGAKPPAFTRWIANLLGATPDDQIDDLFPGSGAVGDELDAIAAQPWLQLRWLGRQASLVSQSEGVLLEFRGVVTSVGGYDAVILTLICPKDMPPKVAVRALPRRWAVFHRRAEVRDWRPIPFTAYSGHRGVTSRA